MAEVKAAEVAAAENPAQTQTAPPPLPLPEIPMLPPTARYFRGEDVAPLVPFALAVLVGSVHLTGATIFLTISGIMAAFAFSSFGLFDWIADMARMCCTGGLLLILLGFGLNLWPFVIRAMLLLVGVGLLTLGVLRRGYWMDVQRAKQAHYEYMAAFQNSKAVDEILSRMANGSEAAGIAVEQWNNSGCAECRAMIRQGFGQLATEKNLATIGKACYMLAVLHSEERIETAEAAADEAEERAAEADELRMRLANLSDEIADLQEAYDRKVQECNEKNSEAVYRQKQESRLRAKLTEAQNAVGAAEAERDAAEAERDAGITKEERNRRIMADHQTGMSLGDLAKKYHLTVSGVRGVLAKYKEGDKDGSERAGAEASRRDVISGGVETPA